MIPRDNMIEKKKKQTIVETKDSDNIEDIKKNLEQLIEVLQTDNTMVDYFKEKYERTEKEKQALHNSLEKTKKKMEAARRKLKEDDKKIEELEKGLSAKSDTIESLMTKHKEEVEELNKKLLQCEREKYDVMVNIEKIIMDLETKDGKNSNGKDSNVEDSNGCDSNESTIEGPFAQLSHHEREMIRCGKLINYAKNMLTLKNKLDNYANELLKQRIENKKNKEELTRYRMNYWDRTMFYNLIMQDLFNLEHSLPSVLLCFKRNRMSREVIQRIKDLLGESMTSYV